eukprot:TRINITY_DN111486_c0_g1_i1.p1 TRINITY_DN111486_c0_g1~~TRINITY_DN111486_c0_g1_i1.p1  ORF type:complete len:161 (-),score=2.14 TRINITY_DN111486_c0_g1_i1:111-593(-)
MCIRVRKKKFQIRRWRTLCRPAPRWWQAQPQAFCSEAPVRQPLQAAIPPSMSQWCSVYASCPTWSAGVLLATSATVCSKSSHGSPGSPFSSSSYIPHTSTVGAGALEAAPPAGTSAPGTVPPEGFVGTTKSGGACSPFPQIRNTPQRALRHGALFGSLGS